MRISSRGRYAIRAAFDLAYHADGRAAQIRDVARREAMPPRFLEQIFQDLRRAGIVESKRGPRGGYSLARPPGLITLGAVLRAVEGAPLLSTCPNDAADIPRNCKPTSRCAAESMLKEIAARVETLLSDVTVADVCRRAEALGVARETARPAFTTNGNADAYMYFI